MTRLPGFTAEASLSKSNEYYEFIADKVQYLKSQGVIPQIIIWDGGCAYSCSERTGRCRLLYCVA
jgi:hypothetical protein